MNQYVNKPLATMTPPPKASEPDVHSVIGEAYRSPGSVEGHAEALHQATGGRLSRGSDVLLQMQRYQGNRHVRRVIDHAQRLSIQPKLEIGQADTAHEREADSIAHDVVHGRRAAAPTQVHGGSRLVAPAAARAIHEARGGGEPLDQGTRSAMEGSLGANLSGVRVHTDKRADALNKALSAKAFTTGQDIFFRRGAYDVSSQRGKELIAHEVTHTLQQSPSSPSGGVVQRTLWTWTDDKWVGGSGAADIEPGEYEGDTYDDESEKYIPGGGPSKGEVEYRKRLSTRTHEQDIKDKRSRAARGLQGKRTLSDLHAALDANGYNYMNVPDEYITQTREFTAFNRLRKRSIRATAIQACRLAMREIAEGRAFSMENDGETLYKAASHARKVAEKTEGYVGRLAWEPGPTRDSSFTQWILGEGGVPNNTGSMNCWEVVLFGAFKAGYITVARIREIYTGVLDDKDKAKKIDDQEPPSKATPEEKKEFFRQRNQQVNTLRNSVYDRIGALLMKGTRYEYNPDDPNSPRPLRGDIVIKTNVKEHVMLALGNTEGSPEVLSLWNTPNNNKHLQRLRLNELVPDRRWDRPHTYFYRAAWSG